MNIEALRTAAQAMLEKQEAARKEHFTKFSSYAERDNYAILCAHSMDSPLATLALEVAAYAEGLELEIERLRIFEQAMESMAAQFIKTTALELAKQ